MNIILNPVVISVILLCVLCLRKVNVLLAIIISAIVAGLAGGMPVSQVMDTFISGMGGNAETALSYILLGTFAAAMTHTGLATILAKKIAAIIDGKKYILLSISKLIKFFK